MREKHQHPFSFIARRASIWAVCTVASAGGGCGGQPEAELGRASEALTAQFSDDFQDATTLGRWAVLNPDLASRIDVNSTVPGNLAMIPRAITYNAWYSDWQAPYVYKLVTGNFVVEASIRVASTAAPDNPAIAPQGAFNSVGLVVRDPSSAQRFPGVSPPPGQESWIMYNLGWQQSSAAREAKTTRRNTGGAPSLSTLYLNNTPGGTLSARLRICRIGSTFHFYHMHPTEAGWVEERQLSTTQVMGNGAGAPTPGLDGTHIAFARPDLPAQLQVGIVANAWGSPAQTFGKVDYLYLGSAPTIDSCTQPIVNRL